MLTFSQKMKTTACQVNTNSRLAKMGDQENAYEQNNFVDCVQKQNILEYLSLFATTQYSDE